MFLEIALSPAPNALGTCPERDELRLLAETVRKMLMFENRHLARYMTNLSPNRRPYNDVSLMTSEKIKLVCIICALPMYRTFVCLVSKPFKYRYSRCHNISELEIPYLVVVVGDRRKNHFFTNLMFFDIEVVKEIRLTLSIVQSFI